MHMSIKSDYRCIESKRGFVAVTAIILLAMGCITTVMIAFTASASYADSVTRREYRIQKAMNEEACKDIRGLMLTKDYFFVGPVTVEEFGCTIEE